MAKKTEYRQDIQALRAIAVLAVVLFHLDESWLPSGFLGVDVFFVISGYVVTMSLSRKVTSFSFSGIKTFYVKRIKRLFPALYFSISVGLLLTYLFIPPFEHAEIFNTALFAILACSNLFLVITDFDYFGVGAEFNPFIHTWSLGVEEQFYLLYPIIFLSAFVLVKRYKNLIVYGLYFLSLLGFVYVIAFKSNVWYYFPLSRFWELLLGAIAFDIQSTNWVKEKLLKPTYSTIILTALIASFFVPDMGNSVLGLNTVFSTHLTCFLILTAPAGFTYLKRFLTNPQMQLIGDMSYSLYLWHYIVFVIFRWTFGLEDILTKIIAIGLTFLFGFLSLKLLENPFRRSSRNDWKFSFGIISVGIILCLIIPLRKYVNYYLRVEDTYNPIAFKNMPAPEKWGKYVKDCHHKYFDGTDEQLIEKCIQINDKKKNFFLVGDSHALQMVFTARRANKNSEYQISYIHRDGIPELLNEGRVPAEIDFILKKANKGDILLVTFFRGKFYEGSKYLKYLLPIDKDPFLQRKVKKRYKNFKSTFTQVIGKAKKKGVSIILVNDVPQMRLPIRVSSCILQDKWGLPNSCDVDRELSLHSRKPMTKLFESLAKHENVYYWDPHDLICDSEICTFRNDRFIKAKDANHITKIQAEELGPHFYNFLFANKLIKNDIADE